MSLAFPISSLSSALLLFLRSLSLAVPSQVSLRPTQNYNGVLSYLYMQLSKTGVISFAVYGLP